MQPTPSFYLSTSLLCLHYGAGRALTEEVRIARAHVGLAKAALAGQLNARIVFPCSWGTLLAAPAFRQQRGVPAGKDFVRLGADNARMTSQHETRKMLAYVAARMGGVEQLASRLGINGTTASHYVTGREVIPDAMVLRVVDLMLEGIPEEQT